MIEDDRKIKLIDILSDTIVTVNEELTKAVSDGKLLDRFTISDDDFRNRKSNLTLAVEITKTKNENSRRINDSARTLESLVKTKYDLITKTEKEESNDNTIDFKSIIEQMRTFEQKNVE